jgi:hypothetical protein
MKIAIPSFATDAILNLYNLFNAAGREFERTHIRSRKQKIKEIKNGREMKLEGFRLALARAEGTLNADQAKSEELSAQASLFARNFESEIDKSQNRKSAGYDTLNRLKNEISGAYEDLNSAKMALDHWYRKSKGNFIGNGGKKLPKHAFFSQDISDRDSLRNRKNSIYERIQALKGEKDRVFNNEIKPAKESIGKIKEDQQRLRGLRAKGETKPSLDKKITSQGARIAESENRVAQAQEQLERQNQLIDNQIQIIRNEIRDLRVEYKNNNK